MNSRFAVIGLGQFGTSIAVSLAKRGADVLAIDRDMSRVEAVKDEVAHAVALDSTDEKSLKAQNIQNVDAAVVAIGEDFECLLLTSVILLELKVTRVISRAANRQQKMILERIGITEILSPEETVGQTVAEMLIQPKMQSFLKLPDDYEIVEIEIPDRLVGKKLREIDLAEIYGLNLITIKRTYDKENKGREGKEHIIRVPKGEVQLKKEDILIVLGLTRDITRFLEINE
jgi:trk system potassium uptake protein TrkA